MRSKAWSRLQQKYINDQHIYVGNLNLNLFTDVQLFVIYNLSGAVKERWKTSPQR